jgi:hypothetical protein
MKIAEVEFGRNESRSVIKVERQADRRSRPCLKVLYVSRRWRDEFFRRFRALKFGADVMRSLRGEGDGNYVFSADCFRGPVDYRVSPVLSGPIVEGSICKSSRAHWFRIPVAPVDRLTG